MGNIKQLYIHISGLLNPLSYYIHFFVVSFILYPLFIVPTFSYFVYCITFLLYPLFIVATFLFGLLHPLFIVSNFLFGLLY